MSVIDPSIGKSTGFGGVILHGLSSYGFAARAVLKSVPGELKAFGVRFTSPVRPGGKCGYVCLAWNVHCVWGWGGSGRIDSGTL